MAMLRLFGWQPQRGWDNTLNFFSLHGMVDRGVCLCLAGIPELLDEGDDY